MPVRPSPSEHAAKLPAGARRRGNDGSMYVVRAAANGVKRWVRVAGADATEPVDIVLRPAIGVINEEGDIQHVTLRRALARKLVSLGDLVGDRANRVVHSALDVGGSLVRVESVAFEMTRQVYVVRVACKPGGRAELREAVQDQFGDLAADTWMEGDICVAPDRELHLELLSCG